MFNTIDLFAGAGGLSFGFEATGKYKIVAAAEINHEAQETYKANHSGKNIVFINDVRGFDFRDLSNRTGGIDVVIGGPPCQGFSNANRQKNHIVSMNNSLVKEYFRAIREIKPKAFVMENVSMLSSDTHRFYDSYKDHDLVSSLEISMKEENLVIADENYGDVDCLNALKEYDVSKYCITDDLLNMLNILYKDRKSKENRVNKYIVHHGKQLENRINDYFSDQEHYDYEILHSLVNSFYSDAIYDCLEGIGKFVKFQKSFRLLKELNDNEIVYELVQEANSSKIIAKVKSYSVIDYVNKILGNDYYTNGKVVNSLWYGVPQDRKRFIMMGVRSDILKSEDVIIPEVKDEEIKKVTVGDAIMDLVEYQTTTDSNNDEIQPYTNAEELTDYEKLMRKGSKGVSNHIIPSTGEKAKKRFEALKEGQNFHKLDDSMKDNYADPGRTQNSIYLKLDRRKPSGTVTNVRKSMWVHPSENRALSIREAARLQSFPDRYIFKGSKNSQYQQVGNAVPPLMAEGIAKILYKYIK